MIDKNLIALLGDKKKQVFFITILNVIGMIASVSITAMFCYVISLVFEKEQDIFAYLPLIIGVLTCIGIKAFCTIKVRKLKSVIGAFVKLSFREKITNKMYDLGINGNKVKNAELTQMSIEGVEQLDLYFTSYIPQFMYAMVAPIILFVICVTLEWKTALVLIGCLPLIPLSIIAVSKYAKRIFAKYWGKYTKMGDGFLDSISGMKELKIFSYDNKKQAELAQKAEEFRVITMKVLVMQLASIVIMDLVAFGGAAVAIVVSILSVSSGEVLPIQALFLVLISAEFFLPMKALGSAFHVAMNGATAGKRMLKFLDLKPEQWGEKELEDVSSVELKDLTFSYIEDKIVLNNINLTLKKGMNGVVGESGSGKSTIASLIIGGLEVDSGNLLYNGTDIKEFSKRSVYDKIAVVSASTFVFNTSIRDNFKLNYENVTDEEIYQALKKVDLYEFVNEVGGLDYVVLEDSENISGGQRQRLALAINLLRKRGLYIFDEATSNIDIESEAIIIDNIQELAKDSIVLIITHRLHNVIGSDNIFMLESGKIIESGTHKSLIKNKGAYENLYTKQFNLENGYKEEQYA